MADPVTPPDLFDQRYAVSRRTLQVDAFMNQFIKVGGVGIIAAVFGIFVFILVAVLPLFQGATVRFDREVHLPVEAPLVLGADEWGELPFVLDASGSIHFADLPKDTTLADPQTGLGSRGILTQSLELPEGFAIRSVAYHQQANQLLLGSSDGRLALVSVTYVADFSDPERRVVNPQTKVEVLAPVGRPGVPVVDLDYYDSQNGRLIAVLQDDGSSRSLQVATFTRRRSLMGPGRLTAGPSFDLTAQLPGQIQHLLLGGSGSTLLVVMAEGDVHYLRFADQKADLMQTFRPFAGEASPKVASANWLLGNTSVVFSSPAGQLRVFSIYRDEAAGQLRYEQFHEFDRMAAGADVFAASLRNRAFLVGSGSELSLRYATTATTRWEGQLPYAPVKSLLSSSYREFFLTGPNGQLSRYTVHDPHPEAGFAAFFSKIRYEGQPKEAFIWESSGAGDEFEPKLSMMPLIFGSLKGTFYALFFAVPIALLAAFYTSQFLTPRFRRVIKPTMEIMASLPSVVLGFLGALFFAPMLEYRFPSVLMILVLLPTVAFVIGIAWGYLPMRFRILIPQGSEFFYYIPILLIMAVAGWYLGPVVEYHFFTFQDPATGEMVRDFSRWWPHVTGLEYNQRSSLIVGFMMGFAVIPIVFTISEDAMSSVPPLMKSAALALGASRWQTAFRVILPAASPAIFSALMIGLGRAVGETMIVVMATGNTAIMDPNIFNGFRALSANIAVELPEAPQGGTLYRTLFLGAMMLFLMTFIINTVAEITRAHLRRRFKTIA